MSIQSIPGIGAGSLLLFCRDCARVCAHFKAGNGDALCGYCGAAQRLCQGNCGRWVPVQHALCDPCEDRLR